MERRYRAVVGLTRLLCQAFFRKVEVVGLENVPRDRGGVLVSWHPNGVIDPGIILATFPSRITFGARDGLFKVPGFGALLHAVGAVPIHRAQDSGADLTPAERRAANLKALDRLAEEVVAGRFSCLFPEGDSHDQPFLLDLKSGAARFFYRAWSLSKQPGPPPALIPVGLHYDAKHAFRSHVLVEFHPPIELAPGLDQPPTPDEPEPQHRSKVERLTDELERVLQEVVHATESWEVHHLMHRVRKLVRSERARRAGARLRRPGMRERQLAFARVWDGVRRLEESDPEALERLRTRVTEYDADLRALGLDDHELDRGPSVLRPGLALLAIAQAAAVFLLLPPFLLLGVGVHLPVLGVLWLVARIGAKRRKDIASIKLLLGAVLFPLTWMSVGLVAALAHTRVHVLFPGVPDTPLIAGLVTLLSCFVGGAAAVRYLRLSRETTRALKVRLTRARRRTAIRRLREERGAIVEAIEHVTRDLDLPGAVTVDGRVVPDGATSSEQILRE